MITALTYFASGCVFGFAGGFSPGPTTTLVVSQTLRFGFVDGMKVAIAPALTDAPIILVAVLLVGQLTRFEPVLGLISLCGAMFLLYLSVESFRVQGLDVDETDGKPQSIRKGFLANLLNPHPYLFWFVIGVPKLMAASRISWVSAVAFLAGIYLCLVGSKILVALLVGRSRTFLQSRGYLYVNRLLGVVLAGFSINFARDGFRLMGIGSAA